MNCNFLELFYFFDKFLTFFCQISSDFVPGRPRTKEFVPGFLLLLLSGDKGTVGQGNVFGPGTKGQRDRKLFCPETKGQQDVPSLGNPSSEVLFYL